MKGAFLPILRCEAVVYRRDTYRLTRVGRGRRFTLRYTRSQCLRRHAKDSQFCWQHAKAATPRE